MTDRPLEGGCFCGAVRYRINGAPQFPTTCHCEHCRRACGAPIVAWFTVATAELELLEGEPRTWSSSERAVRGFCAACGTQLTFQYRDAPQEIDITTASLDEPERVPPADHSYVRSRIGWLTIGDDRPRFETTRAAAAEERAESESAACG